MVISYAQISEGPTGYLEARFGLPEFPRAEEFYIPPPVVSITTRAVGALRLRYETGTDLYPGIQQTLYSFQQQRNSEGALDKISTLLQELPSSMQLGSEINYREAAQVIFYAFCASSSFTSLEGISTEEVSKLTGLEAKKVQNILDKLNSKHLVKFSRNDSKYHLCLKDFLNSQNYKLKELGEVCFRGTEQHPLISGYSLARQLIECVIEKVQLFYKNIQRSGSGSNLHDFEKVLAELVDYFFKRKSSLHTIEDLDPIPDSRLLQDFIKAVKSLDTARMRQGRSSPNGPLDNFFSGGKITRDGILSTLRNNHSALVLEYEKFIALPVIQVVELVSTLSAVLRHQGFHSDALDELAKFSKKDAVLNSIAEDEEALKPLIAALTTLSSALEVKSTNRSALAEANIFDSLRPFAAPEEYFLPPERMQLVSGYLFDNAPATFRTQFEVAKEDISALNSRLRSSGLGEILQIESCLNGVKLVVNEGCDESTLREKISQSLQGFKFSQNSHNWHIEFADKTRLNERFHFDSACCKPLVDSFEKEILSLMKGRDPSLSTLKVVLADFWGRHGSEIKNRH